MKYDLPMWDVEYTIPMFTYDKNGNFKKLKKTKTQHKTVHCNTKEEAFNIVQNELDESGSKYKELSGGKVVHVELVKII